MKYEKITTQEQFDQWREFAATFDHDNESPVMPIVTITNGERMIGHFHELRYPVVFPAFHPSISKREFYDAVRDISAYYAMCSMGVQYPNGVVFAALPKELPIDVTGKMGLEKLNVDLYRKIPQ